MPSICLFSKIYMTCICQYIVLPQQQQDCGRQIICMAPAGNDALYYKGCHRFTDDAPVYFLIFSAWSGMRFRTLPCVQQHSALRAGVLRHDCLIPQGPAHLHFSKSLICMVYVFLLLVIYIVYIYFIYIVYVWIIQSYIQYILRMYWVYI